MGNANSKIILLVEDDTTTSLLEKSMMTKHGFHVETVKSGEIALDIISNNWEIDLILMDIDLGDGMDGTETAEKILELRDIPIVFLTSHCEEAYVDRVKQITKYGYIVKNSGEFVLIESIKMALELHDTKSGIEQSDNRFRKIFENARNIAVQGYYADGTVHFWNKASEELYGYSEEEAIGRTLYDLIVPESIIPYVKESVKEMFKTGLSEPAARVVLKNKENLPVPVYSNHTIIKLQGRETEMYCIDIDMSDRILENMNSVVVESKSSYGWHFLNNNVIKFIRSIFFKINLKKKD